VLEAMRQKEQELFLPVFINQPYFGLDGLHFVPSSDYFVPLGSCEQYFRGFIDAAYSIHNQ
jgi:hypothetical protein